MRASTTRLRLRAALAVLLFMLAIAAASHGPALHAQDDAQPSDSSQTLTLNDGGQFVFWSFGPFDAADIFGTVKIAWRFDPDAVNWTAFIPALGAINFPIDDGDVLWIVSEGDQVIDLAGDVVTADDGSATLTIPPGALPEDVSPDDIQITNLTDLVQVESEDPDVSLLAAYQLEPDGLQLQKPATLAFTAPIADNAVVVAYNVSDAVEGIETIDLEQDPATGLTSITAEVAHFSFVPFFQEVGAKGFILEEPREVPAGPHTIGSTFSVVFPITRSDDFRHDVRFTITIPNGPTTRASIEFRPRSGGNWGVIGRPTTQGPISRVAMGTFDFLWLLRTQPDFNFAGSYKCDEAGTYEFDLAAKALIDARYTVVLSIDGSLRAGSGRVTAVGRDTKQHSGLCFTIVVDDDRFGFAPTDNEIQVVGDFTDGALTPESEAAGCIPLARRFFSNLRLEFDSEGNALVIVQPIVSQRSTHRIDPVTGQFVADVSTFPVATVPGGAFGGPGPFFDPDTFYSSDPDPFAVEVDRVLGSLEQSQNPDGFGFYAGTVLSDGSMTNGRHAHVDPDGCRSTWRVDFEAR